MADIFSQSKRSEIMSRISGKETKPEILVRKYLFSNGFRYRKNYTHLPGTPDIVLKKYKTVIFIQGCFWHGHHCNKGTLPTSNIDFWVTKIKGNIQRDMKNEKELYERGWKVITLWTCDLKPKTVQLTLNTLVINLKTTLAQQEIQ